MWTRVLSFQEEGEDKAIIIEGKVTQALSSHLGGKRCVLQLLSTSVPGQFDSVVFRTCYRMGCQVGSSLAVRWFTVV